jgi:SAM-dependent methyltransferase
MQTSIPKLTNILEIGCGPKDRQARGTEGIDLIDFGQKYVGDFMTFDFPKKYDAIIAHHLIEHIPDTVAFFNKVGEVLNPGGVIDIRVPTVPYMYAFVDPTHVKFIPDENFFKYFTKQSPAGHCYSKTEFDLVLHNRDRYEWELHCILKKI